MRWTRYITRCCLPLCALSWAAAQAAPCPELRTLTQASSAAAYRSAGERYLNQGRTACAADALGRAAELLPGDARLAELLGRTLLAEHRLEPARTALQHAVTLNPDAFAAHMALGAVLHEQGEMRAALGQWEQALRLDPNSALALDWVAKTRLELGEATAAIDLLRNAPRDEATEVDLLLARQRAGIADEAFPAALAALTEHPGWGRLRSALAVTLSQRNRFNDALQVLSRAPAANDSIRLLTLQVMVLKGDMEGVAPLAMGYLADHPHDFEALYLAGLVHRRSGEYTQAIAELREATSMKPAHFDAVFNLGAAEAALHQWTPAREDLRRAIALDGSATEPHFQMAALLRQNDDPAGAKVEAQIYQSLERERALKDRKVSLAAQAAQRLNAGDAPAAIALDRELLTLDQGSAITQYNLALALKAAGNTDEEMAALKSAVRLRGDFALALNRLGYLQAQAGDTSAAEATLRAATASAPGFAEAENNLGSLLATEGRSTEAEDAFRRALNANPRAVEAWTNLAATLAERARYGEAREAAQHALEVDPKDATAQALLRELATSPGGSD